MTITAAVAGHGVGLGRLRDERGTVLAGPDEDALTLAADAAHQALTRAGGGVIDEVLLAAPECSPADAETLLAALRLPDNVRVMRVPDALDAVAIAAERGGRVLVTASDGASAGAVVLDRTGYATVTLSQMGGGAALTDRSRDPRFDRHAGATAVLKRAGTGPSSTSPLVDLAALIESETDGAIASGGPARVSTLTVSDIGKVPDGPTVETAKAAGRAPTPSEARWKPGTRPRGATGVDPDGPLLWRERVELLGPKAAKCAKCGAINAPIAGAVMCRSCGGRELSIIDLPRGATVATYCVSSTLPRAFAAPLAMIYANLDDGSLWKALGPGLRDDDLAIGDRVELVLRRLVVDDGIPVYGLAFRKELT